MTQCPVKPFGRCLHGKLGVPEVLINIVRSFHENMTVQIRLGGELLEGIDVNNGLRQGCTIAPTLFNLYSYAITKRWLSRIKNVESVGTRLLYRLDQQFFRRSTSGAEEFDINECRFADDVVLLATSCAGAQEAITEYHSVAAGLGLSVSFIKTKFMVAGHSIKEEDKQPIVISGGMWSVCPNLYILVPRWEVGHRGGERYSCCIQSVWCTMPCSFARQNPVSSHQETCVSGMCTQCTIVWRGVLDTI